MKLKFKHQAYQTKAVESVLDCFLGQVRSSGIKYRIDPGCAVNANGQICFDENDVDGFKNNDITLTNSQLLNNIQLVQRRQDLLLSTELVCDTKTGCAINLDIEMETGTGKTYCYIKTMFELYKHYGWNKFIVVVPSIAIREGVYKSLEITAEHFLESYGKRIRYFMYNSKQLHNLESFSSDAGINVMVINIQAFNATGKDARRIYEELDDFKSRRPIDVIKSNRPILILDEPQKMEGFKTLESINEFNPLIILRYSATHKTNHNKIYRLDALDAYNQKLVKKIAVRGISVRGLSGTNAYLYLQDIEIATNKPPVARIEMELKQARNIKRVLRRVGMADNFYDLSGGLSQYKGFIVSNINANDNTVSFTNGVTLHAGEVTGDVNEIALRRIQIREAINAHFEKEEMLFNRGIKVLSLFFIDSVAKYRGYDEHGEHYGEYAKIFEEEYANHLNEVLVRGDTPYTSYLQKIAISKTHDGYFSIDKKSRRLIDPSISKKSTETDDVDAYDLILKNKERLLSLSEPVRFIFSHSALREGWDNPNVFVICALKFSDNTISRRQEVGRGMRIAVNQFGDRMDNPSTVHDINVLTVVASESYKDFVSNLQSDMNESISYRLRVADVAYFTGKIVATETGTIEVTHKMAKQIYKYLLKNDYIDKNDKISEAYFDAKNNNKLVELPIELLSISSQIFQLIDSVYNEVQIPEVTDDRKGKINLLNSNFEKKEFKELWNRINRKAVYTVYFETPELIKKCVATLNKELKVSPLQYTVHRGEQVESMNYDMIKSGISFQLRETTTESDNNSINSSIPYDLLGQLSKETQLTRRTIANILQKINSHVFAKYKINPEDFIAKTGLLINEQKATAIVEHLTYDTTNETHSLDIFTAEKTKHDFSKAGKPLKRHIFDYVFTDSKGERDFVNELDTSNEVVVYAKLPKGFFIPTPVGNYSPDWAISFKEGTVKHIYFVAETKGTMSSMELRKVEECKIDCARKFFTKISSFKVKYDVVDSYGKLMELVAS